MNTNIKWKRILSVLLFIPLLIGIGTLMMSRHDEIEILPPAMDHPQVMGEDNVNKNDEGYRSEPYISTSSLSSNDKIIIFPDYFTTLDYKKYYKDKFGQLDVGAKAHKVFRYKTKPQENFLVDNGKSFKPNKIKVFDSKMNIGGNEDRCNDLKKELDIEVGSSKSLGKDLEGIVTSFTKSDYFQEFKPFFGDEISRQLAEKTINKYWFRIAGSSVWLKDYGVYFMISRILYSPSSVKDQPILSFAYAQVFDDKMNELEDVELIVPSNNPDVTIESRNSEDIFLNAKYPEILPIPAFHDSTDMDNKYYGPEDPRITLIQNSKGHEEPLIVYNMFHRKFSDVKPVEGVPGNEKVEVDFGHFRSMFMAWPWRTQRGKLNTDPMAHNLNKNIYTLAVELRRKDTERVRIQKNWTPFTSNIDRQEYRHDKYLYFIYRWADLEVLKCQLSEIVGQVSECSFDYTMQREPSGSEVGPLRGGTELVNINDIVQTKLKNSVSESAIFGGNPSSKEVWMGFARAHIVRCGCGESFYRPNLVLLTKDKSDRNEYKISEVGSAADFGIKVLGYDMNRPDEDCVEGLASAFIPNGISSISIANLKNPNDKRLNFVDEIILTYSLADSTVDYVSIRGLIRSLLEKLTPFFPSLLSEKVGYNNDNIGCALKSSSEMCKEYGESLGKGKDKQNQQK